MAQFNQLNFAETYGRGVKDRQASEMNQLNMDTAKAQISEEKRLENTKWMYGVGKYALDYAKQNEGNPQAILDLQARAYEEMKRRGMVDPNAPPPQVTDPEQAMIGFQKLYEMGQIGMGGPPQPNKSDLTSDQSNYEYFQNLSGEDQQTWLKIKRTQPGLTLKSVPRGDGTEQIVIWDEQSGIARDFSGNPVGGASPKQGGAAPGLGVSQNPVDATRQQREVENEMNASAKLAEQNVANQKTLEVWNAGRAGLISALEGTETGPVVGNIPAVTAAQQTAEGAIAAVAPVLKQLFRSAGEGIFTDRDQQLLLDMVPKRTDHPEARKAKMVMIDAIIQAKLGSSDKATSQEAPPDAVNMLRNNPELLDQFIKKYGYTPEGL